MASVSIAAFTFLLVVATTAAYPMHKEKMTNQDLIKAMRYLWNEEMRKDQHTEAKDRWNEEIDQNSVYALKDNSDEKDNNEDGKGDRAAEQKQRDDKDGDVDIEAESDEDQDSVKAIILKNILKSG